MMEHYRAANDLNAARTKVSQLDLSEARARLAAESFERELGAVYRDPPAARFVEALASTGLQPKQVPLAVGQRVQIISGPFKGVTGIVLEYADVNGC